ncbi:MAG: response regulator [Planctomycetota bacterium]
MVETRPKLVLVGADPKTVAELESLVGDRFEVSIQPGEPVLNGVLRALGEGVLILGPDGDREWTNAFFDALDDHTRRRVAQLCSEAAELDASVDGAVAGKREIESGDGSRFFDVFVTSLAPDEDGRRRVAAIVRDVTIRKRAQLKMDAIDRAGFELVRMDTEEVKRMNALERIQLLEKRIVAYSKELLQFDHFGIFLIDHKRNKLEMVMQTGLPPEIQDLDLYLEDEGSGISGYVAKSGRSYICHDTTLDEKFLPGLTGARSSLTVPLRMHDKVIGIMDIESRNPGGFDDQDRQFAEIFGRYIAMALHMLQLLVTERSAVNENVSGRFEGELNEPLEDIMHEVDWLTARPDADPETRRHVERILSDVESIRRRVKSVASGPQTLLGVDEAMQSREKDPAMVGKRILIADDNPKIRKIIGDVLGNRGAAIESFSDGSQAIERLEHIDPGAGVPTFDLIVSDIQMPDRNGYEVFAAARKHCADAPVILMTGFGYDPHHSIVRASQEGLHGVLFKPFEIELLINQVRDALVGHRNP